jgi:hypothetical protein
VFIAALIGVLNVTIVRTVQKRWFRWIDEAR